MVKGLLHPPPSPNDRYLQTQFKKAIKAEKPYFKQPGLETQIGNLTKPLQAASITKIKNRCKKIIQSKQKIKQSN